MYAFVYVLQLKTIPFMSLPAVLESVVDLATQAKDWEELSHPIFQPHWNLLFSFRTVICVPLLYVKSSWSYFIEHLCQRQNEQQQLPVTQADNEYVFVFI